MSSTTARNDAVKILRDMIKDIGFGMLTTRSSDGTLRSRPMTTQQTEGDNDLWFFTAADTARADEIAADPNVNIAYAEPKDNRYLSVSGVAELVRDRSKMEELWNPAYKAWFPQGLDDPDIALLRVEVESAEYWDAPSSTMAHIAGFVKAFVTGRQAEIGDHGTITMPNGKPSPR